MENMLQNIDPFWIWLAFCCLFLAIEVLFVPSGIFLCVGTASGVVALACFFFPGISWLWAAAIFALLTVASGIVWWKALRKQMSETESGPLALNVKKRQLVGYKGALEEDIKNGRGRLRVNDSHWPVLADADYPAGTWVEVTKVSGITLKVKALPTHSH